MPILALAAAVAGLLTAAVSPVLAICLLLGVVSTTSGLAWLLGAGNQAVPSFFIAGMFAGEGWRVARAWWERRHGARAPEDGSAASETVSRLRLITWMALGAVVVSSTLALLRGLPWDAELIGTALRQAWERGGYFNPPGIAGTVNAAFVAVSGFGVLLLVLRHLSSPRDRRRVVASAVAGAGFAVLAPLLQVAVGSEVYVRADQRRMISSGWSGFFQDPQSYAAFLVLAIALCGGLALGAWRDGKRWRALLPAGIALAAVVPLMFTNSRGGLLAMLVAFAVLTAAYLAVGERRRDRLIGAAAAIVAIVAAGGAVSFNQGARERAYAALTQLGNVRMWEALGPEAQPLELLDKRFLWWQKAVLISAQHPIWGVGPRGYFSTDVQIGDSPLDRLPPHFLQENAHNYFLQFAAELGLVAFAFLLAVLLRVLAIISRGLVGSSPASSGLLAGILAGLAGFICLSIFSHPLLLAELQAWFWGLAGIGVLSARRSAPETRRE